MQTNSICYVTCSKILGCLQSFSMMRLMRRMDANCLGSFVGSFWRAHKNQLSSLPRGVKKTTACTSVPPPDISHIEAIDPKQNIDDPV